MVVQRLSHLGETIFSTMTQLAIKHQAINLGQGFPDADGPAAMLERAQKEIASGNNQYAPGRGFPELRQAIADDRFRSYGAEYDPDTEVLVTVGATEGLTASILGLVEPGAEVIALEPYFDSYPAAVALAGASFVPVALEAHGTRFGVDEDALRAAVTDKTAMIIINSPHNPTGTMLGARDLDAIARVAIEHDLLVLSDEVYEKLAFDEPHIPIASLPGMRERTITVSSAAKCFNVTGWKTGWALAPKDLIDGVLAAKQFMSFVGVSPVQQAVAYALDNESDWTEDLANSLQVRRDRLRSALEQAGMSTWDTLGGYYIVADVSALMDKYDVASAEDFCLGPLLDAGVVAIPVSAFASSKDASRFSHLVRFAFCKKDDVLKEAIRRLATL